MKMSFTPDSLAVNAILKHQEKAKAANELHTRSDAINDLISHGDTLETLWRQYGDDIKAATLAAGDSENDLQMLRAAGVAVVMRNGMAHVQAEADYVTRADCDHDGVAELLERFVLGGAPFAP